MQVNVGDVIYLDGFGNAAREKKGLQEAKVTKIGRQYIYASRYAWDEIKIDKKTMTAQARNANAGYYAYTNKQDYLDRKEQLALMNEVRKYFRDWTKPDLPLDAMRQIKAILDQNTKCQGG